MSKLTKAQIIDVIAEASEDHAVEALKKLTVKKLIALAEEENISLEAEEVADEGEGLISDEEADDILAEAKEQFDYVEGKDFTPKQAFYAAMITEITGVEVSPKQYQAMIVTHRFIQSSNINRARPDYRPRSAASVIKAAGTLLDRASEMVLDDEGAVIAKGSKVISDDIVQRVQHRLEALYPEVDEDDIVAEEVVEEAAKVVDVIDVDGEEVADAEAEVLEASEA
jgi:hypothetical protein